MRNVTVNLKINVPPQKVIEAFIKLDLLSKWWETEKALIEPKVGGLYTLAWNISEKGFEYVMNGIITKFNPESEIEISNLVYMNPFKPIFFGPTKLSVKAKAQGQTSHVTLMQSGYEEGAEWDWYYEAVKKGWPEVMNELKKCLE